MLGVEEAFRPIFFEGPDSESFCLGRLDGVSGFRRLARREKEAGESERLELEEGARSSSSFPSSSEMLGSTTTTRSPFSRT